MTPFTTCALLNVVVVSGAWLFPIGSFHNPLSVRLPRIRILLFFMIFTSYLEKIAMQSSSHNCPMEISDPLCRLLKLYATRACLENACGNGREAFLVGDIILPSATLTKGPIVFDTSLHTVKTSSVM